MEKKKPSLKNIMKSLRFKHLFGKASKYKYIEV